VAVRGVGERVSNPFFFALLSLCSKIQKKTCYSHPVEGTVIFSMYLLFSIENIRMEVVRFEF
jgi:hypothetical protein